MGRHHWKPEFYRQRERGPDQLPVAGAGALHFEVVAPRKKLCPGRGEFFGRRRIARIERVADVPISKAGQRDQPLGVLLGEPGHRELGAAPVLIPEPGSREQFGQPVVAGARSAEQQRAKRLVAVAAILHPAVDADDGLYARGASRGVELHHTEHVAPSVSASAGMPPAFAFATASSMRTMPSDTEYSL